MSGAQIISEARAQRFGFLSEDQVARIAADPATRTAVLLVRCGGGRFTCPAQDVKHFIGIIEANGGDYVRDVSLLAVQR